MSNRSYLNVYQSGRDTLTHVFIEDGKPKIEKVKFKPFLGVHAMKSEQTKWTDIYGRPVKPVVFDSLSEMQKWKKENREGFEILGEINPCVQFVATRYPGDIEIQKDGINIYNLDIEVYCEKGFPRPEAAQHLVNAITVQNMVKNEYFMWGLVDFIVPSDKKVTYFKCSDEIELLKSFVDFMAKTNCHVLTGWNIEGFDIPYLHNRCNRLLDQDYFAKISPENKVEVHNNRDDKGNVETTYTFQGIITWDYMELYKRYQFEPREGKTLNYIASVELGEEKMAYKDEHDDHAGFYKNDPQGFLEYNLRDVELIYLIDKKLAYIELALTIMYKTKCMPDSIYGTLAPWDALMYNVLLKDKKFAPPKKNNMKQDFIGGFVKEPETGLHKWLTVYDIVSSYPNNLISRNLSNETIVNEGQMNDELKKIRAEFTGIEKCLDMDKLEHIVPTLQKYNVSFTSNGNFFRLDQEGLFPSIFKSLFAYRKSVKKELSKVPKGTDDWTRLNNKQHSVKILLNSGYGAISSEHFRYFDIRIAEAITSDGQVCIRGALAHIEKELPILKVKYVDTDSLFISLEEVIEKRFNGQTPDKKTILDFCVKFNQQVVEPSIAGFFQHMSKCMNMRTLTLGMEGECIADVSLFTGKKFYIMNKVWDEGEFLLEKPKLKIRGIQIVRTDTPAWCRERLKKAVNLIFETADNNVLIEFIEESRKLFKDLTFEQMAKTSSANFGTWTLNSSGLPIAVRAAYVFNKMLKDTGLSDKYPEIHDGNKIKYAYIKVPNKFGSNVIGCMEKMPADVKALFKVDIDMQFAKVFLSPLKKMFDVIGWHVEQKNSLEEFFG